MYYISEMESSKLKPKETFLELYRMAHHLEGIPKEQVSERAAKEP